MIHLNKFELPEKTFFFIILEFSVIFCECCDFKLVWKLYKRVKTQKKKLNA